MANYMDLDNLKFFIYDLINAEQLTALERYQDYDRENFDLLIQSTKDFADQELFPVFEEMDNRAAHYKDGSVVVHEAVGKVMEFCGANGYIGGIFDYDDGGLQLPYTINCALTHIFHTSNNSLPGYVGLTAGAAHLIVSFGNEDIKQKFVPKMMEGKWGGTMCLTEPQSGSSLSGITTSATPNDDGSYSIKGQKIFISGGDHQYCENFVHLVLARIDGAPNGTKGISLFAVPKNRVKEDGSLEYNDVQTAGDFQKMGQKGYCTTHLVFGEENDCKAWLVGEANKGLKHMFQMMNGARIDVGLSAASVATAAFHQSLQYAKERPQGRRISNNGQTDPNEQTLIINHPDVRRMLLLQKSVCEGSMALLMQAALYQDMAEFGPDDQREYFHDLLELLTPVAKTYPSEMGRIAVSNGLQILGGYGFCSDFPLQQYYRDIRIMAIYEGTTGIQSLDLLARKVTMKNGAALNYLVQEISKDIDKAQQFENLIPFTKSLTNSMEDIKEVLGHLMQYAMKGENERFVADATIFMEMFSNVVLAWQWLRMGHVSQKGLNEGNSTYSMSFYKNKILTMKYFFKYELPKVKSSKLTIMHSESVTTTEEHAYAFNN